jgi:hypothetical protein
MQDFGPLMSALGQKQTFAPQKVMSALPPKADSPTAVRDKTYIRCLAQFVLTIL